jgi:hypothetical protein
MDPVQPWVDPLEMRRLAEALMTAPSRSHTPADDACFSGEFIGFAKEADLSTEVEDVFPVSQTSPQPAPALPPPPRPSTTPVRGPFLERLSRYRDWLQSKVPMHGMFVLDKDGVVIFDDGDHERLYFMARSMALAAKRTPAESGHVQMRVGSTGLLEVVPVETAYGRMILALIVQQALVPADLSHIAQSLQQAVTPPQS